MSTPRAQGTCFGWQIHAAAEFAYLRGGTGEPLVIDIASGETPAGQKALLANYIPTPHSQVIARLYEGDPGFWLFLGGRGGGWFSIDPSAPRIEIPPSDDPLRREERLWGIPAALCLLARGDLPLHAAAIDVDGAVLFAAPSGFGKTLLAAYMLAEGMRLLAEDLSCIRLGAVATVVPGPAMLRLRRGGLAEQLESSSTHEAGARDERIHLAVDHAIRGDCRPVPIRAVVLLHESDDEVTLAEAARPDAIRDLWALSFRIPHDADRERCFRGVTELAESVPIWRLCYPRRFDVLPQAADRVLSAV